jgi:hypothetical protein
MAKYVHLSRMYLSDEEYYELLSPKNVNRRELLRQARLRGHIFSEKSNESEVRSRLSMLPSDWKAVSDILRSIAKPDPEERKSSLHIYNCAPDNDLSQLVEKAQAERKEKNTEVYTLVKTGDNSVRVDVTYTEVDLSRAVVYQRRERTLCVEITKDADTVHFLHNANERAHKIVDEIKKLIAIKPECQLREEKITLMGIRDAALRTKFFTQLIKGIAGFKYQNATHLTVDRRLLDQTDEGNETSHENDDEPEAKSTAEVMKGLIHKVSMHGDQVIATELYQKAASTGYFITNISWSCVDEKDARFHIDCEAGFTDPATAEQFSFDIVRKWQISDDGRERPEPVALTSAERRNLTDLLEKAAAKSLISITEEYKKLAKRAVPAKPSTAAAA